MAVDDKAVVRHINAALKMSIDAGYDPANQAEMSWRHLKSLRDSGRSKDLSLAAAEWYWFARYSVSTGFVGEFQMKQLSYAYYAKKQYDRLTGDANAEAVTENPVSEPSIDVARWGARGAERGAVDHAALKTEAKPPFWRSVDSIMGSSHGGYRAIGAE